MKMTTAQFEKSLNNGTGRAILFLRSTDDPNLPVHYLKLIIQYSLKNYGWDQQMSSTDRAYYMYRIIKLCSLKNIILRKIKKLFDKDKIIEDWNKYQRFKILFLLTKNNKKGVDLIYELVKANLDSTYSHIIQTDILEHIGIEGYWVIVNMMGEKTIKDSDYYVNNDLFNDACRMFGYDKVRSKLSRLATKNAEFKKYLDMINKFKIYFKKREKSSGKYVRKIQIKPIFSRDKFERKIKRLRNPYKIADELEGLIENYEPKDYKLFEKLLQKRGYTEDQFHAIAWSIDDVFKKNLTEDCKKSMQVIYDKINCQHHRHSAVKILLKNGFKIRNILNEAQFDCSIELQKTAKYYLKKYKVI